MGIGLAPAPRLGVRAEALRSAAFAVLYLVAAYVGRLTVMDHTNLSLIWPAAGVAAVWFVAQRRSRLFALDVALLAAVTMAINTATGASAGLAGFFVLANLAQAAVFAWLFGRWLPQLWGGGGAEAISRLPHLWRLLSISAISTAVGALIGPTGLWLITGNYSVAATAVWLTRNTASMLLIGAAGLRIGFLLHRYWTGNPGRRRAALCEAWQRTSWSHRAEYVALLVVSVTAYSVAFGFRHGLPLAFPLLVVTVWAGLRLHTTFVIVHDLLFGSLAVIFTLHGDGPFASIPSHPARALVVQLFVGVVAVVGLAVALGRDERTHLVDDLRTARREATDQAEMLRTVVDSMTEGLAVIDAEGRFLLRNPAARDLLGGVTSGSDRMRESAFYGLYRTDGTLVPDGEFPYQRALATGEPHAMDIVVRNPSVPQSRTLAVHATLMPNKINGIRYAVTVFSDVTAERRRRDELTAFAGVVAHDLNNPLTTVEGWSEELIDVPGAGPAVTRIRRASARMRNLINDLLNYTTARDGRLELTDVDLSPLITDIAAARVDQAESTGAPVPRITLGSLPVVRADEALMRQLFENVIGNAIKYTAPGVVPRLTVYATADGDDIRVCVADNGIGIPAGQHAAVFENFHRAHRTSDYAGTGLGLAICKRITERHGGTITAADNPSGAGTVVTITIPLATQPSRPRPAPLTA
ncbi:ATP-binding protein [Actinoplanes sichuanensis]|uniref:Sensor-like histidine kinase SenX3 n=1 Tax=Actinoplanes sichuanensis TaxID=512349 RepID=A0ABW4A8K8_9ACTN|nr:ATP-binding protein [Actinoplanes sichuanensis]